MGDLIEHHSLDWGGSFPGSHAFYRTRDKCDEDIFILKPKQQTAAKRKAIRELPSRVAKRNLQAYVHNGNEERSGFDTLVSDMRAIRVRAETAMSPLVIGE